MGKQSGRRQVEGGTFNPVLGNFHGSAALAVIRRGQKFLKEGRHMGKRETGRKTPGLNRRDFIGGAALGFTIVRPESVRSSQANSTINLGLIGCGGRGLWIGHLFNVRGYKVVAVADYFADKANAAGDKLQVDPGRRYSGLSGYKKLLESKVDAIAVESPPYFHPEQAAAGVDAGVHVYLAKPAAVDVAGCRSVEESARRASEKKLCFLIDFQTRTDPFYKEAVDRVRKNALGKIIGAEAFYLCGPTFEAAARALKENPGNPEIRLRSWGLDRTLSGDIITEQNIHAIDVAAWILDAAPLRAYGAGGRKARDQGDCYDNFSVIYSYPGDIDLSFHSKQYGRGIDDICARAYGTEGYIDTHYSGEVFIRGNNAYLGGKVDNLYLSGAVRNIEAFHKNIGAGDFSNATVAPGIRSNLTTILGRTAAYRRGEATWDEMMKSGEKLEYKLDGLKS
jgi:myo-inositol 2-dehydrogenase / D-chiro-inositol 1-dehydrogenase